MVQEMVQEIINFIKAIIGCQFATIVYESDVKMSAKSGLKDRVKKLVKISAQINYSYQNAVNNRLDAIGAVADFVSKPLAWGQWFIPNKVIAHKGEYYLRFYTYDGGKAETIFFLDNHKASADEIAIIKANLPKPKEPSSRSRQTDAGLMEHQVCPKVVNIKSILAIVSNGQTIGTMPTTETKAE